ncbi:MAG TPA: NADH-quinone oxidoreductase subunit N [Ktedonobacterales bacterium]|jgi:NADH-quinone oxidoreductase subunit N|nr:NADH-quinone oxidoreductase subunit N [Ktedonobacterales bacterium]
MTYTYVPTSADWLRILPQLIVLGAALLTLIVDLFLPAGRKAWLYIVALAGVIGAGVATALMFSMGDGQDAFFGMVRSDWTALLAYLIILLAAALGILFSPDYLTRRPFAHHGEYYALLLLSTFGMMLMSAAASLMIVFVGLEALSLPLYILCAILPRDLRSQESGLKYFLLSSFASAFLLYGISLTFGSVGTSNLAAIRALVTANPFSLISGYGPILVVAIGLMAVGLAFKVSAVPFQAWTPDVYVGAPAPVTAFMSVGTKVAAFVAIARIFLDALQPLTAQWQPIFWALTILTIVGGNLLAITQRDVKRMLAYSSVANAGYMLIAITVATQQAYASLLVYLATYAVMNLGAFGVVGLVERADKTGATLDDFAGLGRRRPLLAGAMAVFLFALAGIPLTSGFVGKFSVFYTAVQGGDLDLALLGAVASVAGMFYYLRVVWAIYFTEPGGAVAPLSPVAELTPTPGEQPIDATASADGGVVAVAERVTAPVVAVTQEQPIEKAPASILSSIGLAIAVIGVFALGIAPWLVTPVATEAARMLFAGR